MCEKEIEKSKICIECARGFNESLSMEKEIATESIRIEHSIRKIEEIPVIECRCTNRPRDVTVFDFYTVYNSEEKEYNVILCSQCRTCGGYFKFFGKSNSNFPLRSKPPHAGFTLMPTGEQRIDYII